MVAELRKAIELNPKNTDALNYLGYSYADKGIHLTEAESLVGRALEARPDNGYILDSLGWVYYKQGKLEKALELIKRASQTTKDDPVVLEHLGDIYKSMNEPRKAADAWEKSLLHHEKEEGLKERVEEKIRELGLPAPGR
nr:tetratricopeptide repeat protein [Nitrospiraceae bacterium]